MKNVPSIGGQSPAYFIAAMRAYKDGERSHATMRDVAHSLSQRDRQPRRLLF
jgi:cytochrome c553